MQVWYFDEIDGALVGSGPADVNQLAPDEYIQPQSGTFVEPPAWYGGYIPVWRAGAWVIEEDHRGETWWDGDGSVVEVDFIGDPAGRGLTDTPPPPPPPSAADVNAERDRRAQAGFGFRGKTYQFSDADRQRINGAGTLAALAIMGGAQPGDLRWHGGASDFVWIAADNSLTAMDAQTVVAFGQAAAAWESAHVFAARALKDLPAIPADYAADGYWPAGAS